MTKQKQIDALNQRIEALKAEVAKVSAGSDSNYEDGKKWRALADEREKILTAERKKALDLKERLSNSESENARMRGYIQRVQEDDTVREDLVAVGDPEGQQRLVPKRKPTEFCTPNQYTDFAPQGAAYNSFATNDLRAQNTKHWVTY